MNVKVKLYSFYTGVRPVSYEFYFTSLSFQNCGLYPASRGPSIFLDKSTYLGRSKGLCSQGMRSLDCLKKFSMKKGVFLKSNLQYTTPII